MAGLRELLIIRYNPAIGGGRVISLSFMKKEIKNY